MGKAKEKKHVERIFIVAIESRHIIFVKRNVKRKRSIKKNGRKNQIVKIYKCLQIALIMRKDQRKISTENTLQK